MNDDHLPMDVRRILDTLERHEVCYLIVGGITPTIHRATRQTFNSDDVSVLAMTRTSASRRCANRVESATSGWRDDGRRAPAGSTGLATQCLLGYVTGPGQDGCGEADRLHRRLDRQAEPVVGTQVIG